MTTDELRAKFEAWYPDAIGDVQPFECYMKGYASRDAEVEALKRDAERYRKLCVVIDEDTVSEDILGSIIDDAIHLGSGALTQALDKDFDGYFPGIDATMQE